MRVVLACVVVPALCKHASHACLHVFFLLNARTHARTCDMLFKRGLADVPQSAYFLFLEDFKTSSLLSAALRLGECISARA